MLGPEINARLDTGPIQNMCGAGSVSGPDFWENLTSLIGMSRAGETGREKGRLVPQDHMTANSWGDRGTRYIVELGPFRE